jgi:PilZ domain
MFKERRRSKRQVISRHAKFQVPGSSLSRDCVVSDLSRGGVRLHVEGVEVPDRFVLLVSDGSGRAQPRDCQVVWRLGFEVGAEFRNGGGPSPA